MSRPTRAWHVSRPWKGRKERGRYTLCGLLLTYGFKPPHIALRHDRATCKRCLKSLEKEDG